MATNLARLAIHATSVIDPDTGREQITIKVLVKKRILREERFTSSAVGRIEDSVGRYLWRALNEQLIIQGAVFYVSSEHPFQEELPF